LLDLSKNTGQVLCFFGSFGIGKTSFSKFLGQVLATEVIYYDCSSRGQVWVLKDIEERQRYRSLDCLDDIKQFEKCFILDEFHSLTTANKNSFKIPLEEMTATGRSLFLICVNANEKNLETNLTGAIKSRCLSFDFDIKKQHFVEVAKLVKQRFPVLDDSYIKKTLPDLRQIMKRVKM
jgi:replication-associated recombination protein RarA